MARHAGLAHRIERQTERCAVAALGGARQPGDGAAELFDARGEARPVVPDFRLGAVVVLARIAVLEYVSRSR